MQRTRNLLSNICFALNCLLVFLLLFESRLSIPAWLQVAGRMHTMLLHFPLVLLILYIIWMLFMGKRATENEFTRHISESLLLFSALTAAISALMGLFLSKEEGFDTSLVNWHKWGGTALSLFSILWFTYREKINRVRGFRISISLACLLLLVFTGHQGATITHGENYLLAPVSPEKKATAVLIEEAEVYAHLVRPVLESKCMSCHNAQKAKGHLSMETEALLVKGGKNGKLWDTTAAGFGLLLNRVHLDPEDKKHMPPKGKPQLTDQEIQLLYLWIKSGAGFKTRVMDLPETDSLRIMAHSRFNTIETDDYDFTAADETKVKNLNNNYRVVSALAMNSPALGASFFSASAYSTEQLKDLLAVKKQLVSLNLTKMPVKDEELKTISEFSNLRKLNLSFTSVSGLRLEELNKLKELRQLSLSGTAVKKEDIRKLTGLKKLAQLYLWNTGLSEEDIKELAGSLKGVKVEKGFNGDTTLMKLTAPVLLNEEQIISDPILLRLKHYVNGVSIRFTLDGTDPDSIKSPEYKQNTTLTQNVTVKAKAFKQGWISSDIMETYFFSAKHRVDSVINLLPPEEQYKGDGPRTLTDLVKGEAGNFKSGKWLGYRKNKMESLLQFSSPVTVSSVTLSTLVDIGGYIMPPLSIEVWGGDDAAHLKLLRRLTPEQPLKVAPAYLKAFELSFSPVLMKYIKIVAVPVSKLPLWHPGKGDKGWIFADEVFVN